MITKREEYDRVTIPSDMVITGYVYPRRIGDERYWLRGEDIAFAMELMNRHNYVASGSEATTRSVMTKQILGARIQNVVDYLHKWGQSNDGTGKPIRADATFQTKYVFDQDQSIPSMPSMLEPNNVVPDNAIISRREAFETGQPFRSAPIGYLFDDLAKMRRFQLPLNCPYDWGYVTTYKTQTKGDQSYIGSRHTPRWPYLYKFRAESYFDDNAHLQWAQKRWTISGGSFKVEIDRDKKRYLSGTALILFQFSLKKSFYIDKDGQWTSIFKHYVFVDRCSAVGNVFQVTTTGVMNHVNQIKLENGLSDSSNIDTNTPSSDGSSGVFEATISINTPYSGVFEMNSDMNW